MIYAKPAQHLREAFGAKPTAGFVDPRFFLAHSKTLVVMAPVASTAAHSMTGNARKSTTPISYVAYTYTRGM